MFAEFWVSWDEEDGFISLLTNKRCKKISNLNNNRKISWKLVVIFISLAGLITYIISLMSRKNTILFNFLKVFLEGLNEECLEK
jgi:hypothetical protein